MSESENFNKIVRLLARGGTMVLRNLLQKYSPPVPFCDFLYQNQSTVLKIKLNDKQLRLVAARDLDKMDITLLSKLVIGLFKSKMTDREKQLTLDLVAERDNFMHSEILEAGKISCTNFSRKWQELSTLLEDMAKEIGDLALQTELYDFIEDGKKTCPDLADIYKILIDWCQSKTDLEEKIDDLRQSIDGVKSKY